MDTQSYANEVGDHSQKFTIQDDSKMAGYILIALGGIFAPAGIVAALWADFVTLGSGIMGSCCGVAMGIVGIVVTIWRTRRGSTYYLVGDQGILKVTGNSKVVVQWDQLREYRQQVARKIFFSGLGLLAFSVYDCSFKSDDDVTLIMSDRLNDIPSFIRNVWGKLALHLTPKILSQLNRGDTVNFGRLSVSKTTLTVDANTIGLESVESIQIVSGNIHFRIHKDGKAFDWVNVAAAEVVNLPVFVDLVREGGPIGKLKGSVSLDQEKLWTGLN